MTVKLPGHEEVVKSIQDAFRKYGIAKLAPKAISLAFQIIVTARGIRTAFLIDVISASTKVARALHSAFGQASKAIHRVDQAVSRGLEDLFCLIHAPSGQMFVISRNIFLSTVGLDSGAIERDHPPSRRYVCVAKEASLSNKDIPKPKYLPALLEAVAKEVSISPIAIVLDRQNDNDKEDRLSQAASEGVALAGWLLEYEVIYFFPSSVGPVKRRADRISLQDRGSEGDVSEKELDHMPPALENNLKDASLILFNVNLHQSGEASQNLYSFTCPTGCIYASHENHETAQGVVEAMKRRITTRLLSRLRQEEDAIARCCGVEVKSSITIQDRVAL